MAYTFIYIQMEVFRRKYNFENCEICDHIYIYIEKIFLSLMKFQ